MGPKRLLVNLAAATVAEKRTFGKAFRETGCLVPVNGFYVYRKSDRPRTGWYGTSTGDHRLIDVTYAE